MKKVLFVCTLVFVFILGDRILSKSVSGLINASEFRFSKLYSSTVSADVAIFGNSRALHSLYAPELNSANCYSSFQFSYNGLSIFSVEQLIYDYIDRHPNSKVIILEVSTFYSDNTADQRLTIYSGISDRISEYMDSFNTSLLKWNKIFKLLNYNNEMMTRSLLFSFKSDQNWINRAAGTFASVAESDDKLEYVFDQSRKEAYFRLKEYISKRSIELILYAAPYHDSVDKLVSNPYTWDEGFDFTGGGSNQFLDFRSMPLSDDHFTDYLHTNIHAARSINKEVDKSLKELIRCDTK